MQALPRIVVVGGGAGGLELISLLGRKIGRLGRPPLTTPILVDSNMVHVWKPLYHELATGGLNTTEDAVNLFQHAFDVGAEFELGKMNGLDRQRKVIHLAPMKDAGGVVFAKGRDIKYNKLVLAVGSRSHCFGTPGVAENCIRLDSIQEAEQLKAMILRQAFRAVIGEIPCNKVRIGIIGGGPTGVELAAEIHHQFTSMRAYGANLSSDQLEITLLEAGPRILSASTERLSTSATVQLRNRDIKILTKCGVKAVTNKGFQLEGGRFLEAEIRVWCAGVEAPDWLSKLGLSTNKFNQILVDQNLQALDDPNIFAIGDCAECPDGYGAYIPATAQAAHQQAKWLTNKLIARLKNKDKDLKPFVFDYKGTLVSLGEGSAIGNLVNNYGFRKNLGVSGKSAKILYKFIYHIHQYTIFGPRKAGILWLAAKIRNTSHTQIKFH